MLIITDTYLFDDAKKIDNATHIHMEFTWPIDVDFWNDNVEVDK